MTTEKTVFGRAVYYFAVFFLINWLLMLVILPHNFIMVAIYTVILTVLSLDGTRITNPQR